VFSLGQMTAACSQQVAKMETGMEIYRFDRSSRLARNPEKEMGRCLRNDQEDKPERDSATLYIHVKIPAKTEFTKEGLLSGDHIQSTERRRSSELSRLACRTTKQRSRDQTVKHLICNFPVGKWIRHAAQGPSHD
jgi:hypothetical protein